MCQRGKGRKMNQFDMMNPANDWMLLTPCEKASGTIIMPDIVDPTKDIKNFASFKIEKIGPAKVVKTMAGDIDIIAKVGDEVILEGLDVPVFHYEGRLYYAARARAVAFIVKKE